jgi:cystathionine beta-lyase/cystathionine gamma-synthase
MGFSTDAVHGGQSSEKVTGAVITPIYQTSTYEQEGLGEHRGYEYARTQNPTREVLERNIAVLERGKQGVAFASGMAATSSVFHLFSEGDEVVISDNTYGGTYRVAEMVFKRLGIRFNFVDTTDPDNVRKAITPKTKLVFIETPTNPVLKVTDIAGVASIAHENGVRLLVDNTFMSPYFQNPIELGADLVLHSTTKYLNGHSDMVGGIVIVNDDSLAEDLRFIQNSVGAVPGPFDCWLALRGTKTLAVRMRQHEANARQLAERLKGHPEASAVYYPGFPDHPGHELQKKQARGFGAMISVDVGNVERANHVLKATHLFTLAESLGGVESLISHPATMTHAAVPKDKRNALGVTDGLVRLSVGIEDVEDLEEDLENALKF